MLRLDPCVGLWTLADTTFRQNWILHGDMRTQGAIVNQAVTTSLDGDVFATALSGNGCVGRVNTLCEPVVGLATGDGYVCEPVLYVHQSPGDSEHGFRDSRASGVATETWCLAATSLVNGMLLVTGNLTIAGSGVQILAAKNLPALYVGGNLVLQDANNLTVQGLAVVDGDVQIGAGTSGVQFIGGLCLGGTIRETTSDVSGYDNEVRTCGSPAWTTGVIGNALDLDGAVDYDKRTTVRRNSNWRATTRCPCG